MRIFTLFLFVSCVYTESLDERMLSRLESQLLKLTNMDKRPNNKKNVEIPEYMLEMYRLQTGNEVDTSNLNLPGKLTRSANTVRSFVADGLGRFDISSIPKEETVTSAELRIELNATKKYRVIVNDVVKNTKNGKVVYPVDSKLVRANQVEVFDVIPAVARWRQGAKNLGLQIDIYENNQLVHISKGTPVLITYSDDQKNKKKDMSVLSRQVRAAQQQRKRKNNRNKNRKRNLCAKHKMFVDFTDVGWNDWIVAPPGYHAYHCMGECQYPMAEHLNATNHAVIQALVNSMNPGLVPPPCCVPTKYSSLSLLYTDSSDKIVLKNYNEMVVDSCGCS